MILILNWIFLEMLKTLQSCINLQFVARKKMKVVKK